MEICICDHSKENHKGLFKKKQCKLCDCIEYTNVREFSKRKHVDEETVEDIEEELEYPESIISKLPDMVIMLVLIAMMLGAGAIMLSSLQDATTVANVSYMASSQINEQMPMIGTLMGVGMLLMVVIGVFAFFAKGGD